MAIDYSGYAQAYGGDRQTGQALGQTLGMGLGSIPTFKERYGRYEKSAMDKYTNPMLKALSDTDIEDIDMSDYKTGPTAFAEYAETLKKGRAGEGGKGGMFARKAERKGLVDAKSFIDRYNTTKETMKPDIAKRIMGHAQSNFLGNDQMKTWVASKPGLRKFILDAYEPGNPQYEQLRSWALGDESWKQWGRRKGLNIFEDPSKIPGVTAKFGLPLASTAYSYKIAKDMYKGKFGKTMTSKQIKDSAKLLSQSKSGPAITKLDKTIKNQASKLTKDLTKLEKNYKGKNFKNTKKYKTITKKITDLTQKSGKTALTKIQSILSKHGASGVIKHLSKKLGWGGALKIASKLGLGTALSATGIGTVVGIGMNALTILQVYNLISELAE